MFDKTKRNLPAPKPGLLAVHLTQRSLACVYLPNIIEYVNYSDPKTLPDLLKAFVQQHGLQGVSTTLILDKMDYRLIHLDAPNLSEKELGTAAKWLVKDFIDFPLEQALVDAFKLPARTGQPAKMVAVVTKLDRMKELVALCMRAGLAIHSIDIPELALRNLMARMGSEEEELGLVSMQPEFQTFLVTAGKELSLARSLEAPMAYLGTDQEDDPQSVEKLTTEIDRSLRFYSSQNAQKTLSKILVGTELKSEAALIQAMREEISTPLFKLVLPEGEKANRCLIAVGGAQRSNDFSQNINLFAQLPVFKEKKQYMTNQGLIGLLAATGVLALGLCIQKAWSYHTVAQRITYLTTEMEGANQMLAAVTATNPDVADATLEKKDKEMEQKIAAKKKLLEVLDQASGTNGYSAKLEALAETISADTWLTNIVLNDIDTYVGLTGDSQSSEGVFQFVDNLGNNAQFSSVKFQAFTVASKEQKDLVTFVLSSQEGGHELK